MNDALRRLYDDARLHGKALEEWWWCRDPALHELASSLQDYNHVIIDNFLLQDEAKALRAEVGRAYDAGLLKAAGTIGGGRFGRSESFTDESLRGDILGYFDGTEEEWIRCGSTLKRILDKMNTVVCELRDAKSPVATEPLLQELEQISTRSRAMVTCYPGRDAHYTKHYDNAIGNGRKLTTILYLNEWKPGDGGELRMYHSGATSGPLATIEPIMGRLVMFWSDERCPHEVLPTNTPRFAITLWFIDAVERDQRAIRDDYELFQEKPIGGHTSVHDSAVEATVSSHPSPRSNSTLLSKPIRIVPSEDSSCLTYEICSFTAEDMKKTLLDCSCEFLVVSSSDDSFDKIKIQMPRPVIREGTKAKYKKKMQTLEITVYFNEDV